MFGIGGEVIPEAIKVDPLAPGDEALHVRATEPEMPEQRALDDLFPRSDPRHRRIDQDKAPHALGVLYRKSEADHIADVVGDEINRRYSELVEDADDIASLRLFIE